MLRNLFFQRISVRLALWYGLTLLLLLSAFSLFTYLFFQRGQIRDFDRHLIHERMQLLPFVEVTEEGPRFRGPDELRSVSYQTEGTFGTFVRLLTEAGEVVYQSPNLEGRHLEIRVPSGTREVSIRHTWMGEWARTLYTPLEDEEGRLSGWLEVTGYEWALQQELRRLARAMLLGILLSVTLAVFGGYILAKRALRPVSTMTEAADRIRATDLSARLPTRFGVRDELTELAETFNRMIDRLESSFKRERRFTDNAAHELLTPLTTISNAVQIALRRNRPMGEYRRTLATILTDVEEMSETVQGLLQLARIDRVQDLDRTRVDFSKLVEEYVDRYMDEAESKGVALQARIEPRVGVEAETGPLGDVLNNLLENALKYTPAGGRIDVDLRTGSNGAVLSVTDTGVGFEPDEAGRLFDRFYRSNLAAVQQKPGSGLGLSIVKAITEAYGGRAHAKSDGPGRGSRFEVWLPRADAHHET